MATKTLTVCDQCEHEESNESPHAHSAGGMLPVGWMEVQISVAPPLPLPRSPSAFTQSPVDVIDAEFEPDPAYSIHQHVLLRVKRAMLCPACSEKFALCVGDDQVKFVEAPALTMIAAAGRRVM